MKEKIARWADDNKEELYALGKELFLHPELGFKEEKTKAILVEYLHRHGLQPKITYAKTGFAISIGSGYPHIGLMAEMDAIPTPEHPNADPVSKAAHACGHSAQCAVMAEVMVLLNQLQITEHFPGKVTLYFTPAEEFTDLAERKAMRERGEIHYLSGKQEMLAEGILDDTDLIIHLHGSGAYHGYRFSVGSSLAGFIYKSFTFQGKAAHAAVMPDQGINALNAFALFQSAAGMLRETYREEDLVRFHGIITEGGSTVNSIPDKVVYESYIRSANPETLQALNAKLTECAEHCAKALGATCIVKDIPGYLPLVQNQAINTVIEANMKLFVPESEIKHGEKNIAAGDIGDVSMFLPTVQYGYTGFSGVMHGKDLLIADEEEVYLRQVKLIAFTVYDLLSQPETTKAIIDGFTPKITKEEYLSYLAEK